MILGIGVDLLNIARIEKVYLGHEKKFSERILSEVELKRYAQEKNKHNFLAKRFCAKEAFLKATGLGIGRGVTMRGISVENDSLGKPLVVLSDDNLKFLANHFKENPDNIKIDISITDEFPYITSFVVISSIK